MRILFIVDDYSGGAGNVVQLLANQLINRNNQVDVMLLNHHSNNNKLSEFVNVVEKELTENKSKNKFCWLFTTVFEIKREINLLNPQVVISFLTNNNILTAFAMMFMKVPLIVSERSNPMVIKPSFIWRILRFPAYSRANVVTVQCSNFVNFDKIFLKKTKVVPNPIMKPEIIISSNKKKENYRIISVGRLAKVKQYDALIKVFKIINSKVPNTELYIYGEGSERNKLTKLISDLDLESKVFLPGKTKEVYKELRTSDIYLMTSLQEGFPNALGEAMAIGLPVVAFECHEGLRDIVSHGTNGFLVQPNDIVEMANKTILLLENEDFRKEVSKEAVKIADKFSMKKIIDIWDKIIDNNVGEYQ